MGIQNMEKITNKKIILQLDSERGILYLSELLVDTMVYLYNESGKLQVKEQYTLPSLVISLPKHGVYVLVLFHPTCQVEVKKIVF